MPRLRQEFIVNLAQNLVAFLRLDAGFGRSVPPASSYPPKAQRSNVVTSVQDSNTRTGNESLTPDMEAYLRGQIRKEREGRRKAEEALRRPLDPSASVDRSSKMHALPEPDESLDRRQIFKSLLSSLKVGKMLDLGTGPGSFSIVAAKLGWEVTAVDARTMRIPVADAQTSAERARLIQSIKWVESDVREFPIEANEYDLVCVLGLMHHLRIEDQLALLKKFSDTLTILDCRVAPEIVVTEGPFEGFYYQEMGENREERDKIPVASWGNDTSFRHTEESLIRLLRDCGYDRVMAMRPPHHEDYTFYVAIPVS